MMDVVITTGEHPQNEEEEEYVYEYTSSDSSEEEDEDERQLVEEEIARNGFFDFDFSKVKDGRDLAFRPVIFNKNYFTDEPDTDGALLERLSRDALMKHNAEEGTSLEFLSVVKANFHPGGGITFYITFEAKDASHLRPKLYQTMISYLPMDIRILWCKPRPCTQD